MKMATSNNDEERDIGIHVEEVNKASTQQISSSDAQDQLSEAERICQALIKIGEELDGNLELQKLIEDACNNASMQSRWSTRLGAFIALMRRWLASKPKTDPIQHHGVDKAVQEELQGIIRDIKEFKDTELADHGSQVSVLNEPGQHDDPQVEGAVKGRLRGWYESLLSASSQLEDMFNKASKFYTFYGSSTLVSENSSVLETSLQRVNRQYQEICWSCSYIESSDNWTRVDPSKFTTNEAMLYRLDSSSGRYECSVSGLRWVCKSNVSLQFQFSSWDSYLESLKSMQYTPGGPILDITVNAGELEEVHLPHFVCLGQDPSIKDNMRVAHIDDCGISVEQVCEVTPFHIKLLQPSFSAKGVLMKRGFPVKFHCNMLLYCAKKASLTMHAYLIPRDVAVEQKVDEVERADGYKMIRKPQPESSLRMKDWYSFRTSCPSEIMPNKIKLKYPYSMPNFCEVYVEDADIDFGMDLMNGNDVLWTLKIRKGDFGDTTTKYSQDQHFVDRHRADLIQRVRRVKPILDKLLEKRVILNEEYCVVSSEKTTQDQMRALYPSFLAAGAKGKDVFHEILRELEPDMVKDLERK